MGTSPAPSRGAPAAAVLEGWLFGAVTLLVLVALATVALLVWQPLPDMTGMLGTALLGVACLVGGGHAARKVGHMGLVVGTATGLLLALSALLLLSLVDADHPEGVWLRFGTGVVAGALGGMFGVAAGAGVDHR